MQAKTARQIEAQIAFIAGLDDSITPNQIALAQQAAVAALNGVERADNVELFKPMTRKQVAALLGVTVECVSRYARRGLIQPVRGGVHGKRAAHYTASSVRAFISGKPEQHT